MRIGIVGAGAMAQALGARWIAAGHEVALAGRDEARTAVVAARLGAATVELAEVGVDRRVVLVAVPALVAEAVLARAGGLAGVVLIDVTNPVEHSSGVVTIASGSIAQRLSERWPGSDVVKAFNLLPADTWADATPATVSVPLAGDDADALAVASELVVDAGGVPLEIGGLDRARQLEEAAGIVIALVFAGADPRSAVPGPVRP